MKSKIIISLLFIAILVIGIIILNSRNSSNKNNNSISDNVPKDIITSNNLTKTNEEGAVSVAITFLNPVENNNDYWVFEMAINTHSVNLDQYDFHKLTSLSIDDKTFHDEFVFEKEGIGHHITYNIKVPKIIDGNKIITKESKNLILYLKDIDGIPLRTYEWDLTQYKNHL